MRNQRLIPSYVRMKPSKGGIKRGFEIRIVHGDYFWSRMPLNATQQVGAQL